MKRDPKTDDKKKPEDETPQAQAEDAKPSEDLSDDELSNAAGGTWIMPPAIPPVQADDADALVEDLPSG